MLAKADRSDAFAISAPDVRIASTMDHRGFATAAEVSVQRRRTGIAAGLARAEAGRQCWIAVDLKRAASIPCEAIEVSIFNYATGASALLKRYRLPDQWRRVRTAFTLPASPSPNTWQLLIQAADDVRGTQRFLTARLFVYHGREPAGDGHLATLGDGKWDGAHLVMGSTHLWEHDGALYIKVGSAPTGPTDGTRIG